MATKISGQLHPKLTQIFATASLTALASFTAMSQPSYAGGTKFYCAAEGGQYFTFTRTEDGQNRKIMGWTSTYFPSQYSPKKRCQEVSTRFQRNYDNGTLKKIASGIVNKETVICSGSDSNTVCNSGNLLFTLRQGTNGREVANRLFNRQALAGAEIMNQNSDTDDIMFDFDTYLNKLPPEQK